VHKAFLFKYFLLLATSLVIGLTLTIAARPALAQDCPSPHSRRLSQTPIIKDMVNPNLSEGDFELPMPCGGKLIFRHVCIPAKHFFGDLQLNIGCENCGRPDQGFMEGKRITTLAGAFTFEDLPEPWRVKLRNLARKGDGRCPQPDDKTSKAFYYFIGKYEIATFQWKAIMDGVCPGWDVRFSSDDPRPKTNISWFEAIEFTRRYTEWLLKNRPDTLPKFSDGRIGYIRLPTEPEWEYAARGGHIVNESQLNREDFFPLKNRTYSDYAVYTGADAAKPTEKLAWIGSKCANPLGLFDTAGNAAEMMLDPFRFSIDSRLHGAAGGFVVKGGSYRKRMTEMMPGRREEMPYFLKDGAFRSTDLGFRVVLSGIVNPHNRNNTLRRQWPKVSRQSRPLQAENTSSRHVIEIDRNRDLVTEIERLIAAASDDVEQKNLWLIKDYIREANAESAEYEAQAFELVIWKALFAAESILKYASQRKQLQKELEDLNKLKTQTLPETEMESLNANIAVLTGRIGSYDAAVDYFVKSYIDNLAKSQEFPEDAVERQFNLIFQNHRLEETIGLNLQSRLGLFKKHIALYNNQPENISAEKIKDDIVLTAAR